jgi:hypothetical protein
MAGKVLTKEDFDGSGEPNKDTPKADAIPADQKFDQDGKAIAEGPVGDELPPEKEEPGEEPLPKPPDSFKPKHKTWEETERAREDAERKMHEATTKSSDYEKRLALLEKPPEKQKTIDDHIEQITEQAGKEIDGLQVEYDIDGKPTRESLIKRDRDARLLWAKAERQIVRLELQEQEKAKTAHHTIATSLYNHASKEGLKTDDELDMVGMAFDRTDPSLNLDDRVGQAVDTVKTRISRLREGFIQKQKSDKEEKDELKVLGRGSSRSGGRGKEEKDTKPDSMSKQLSEMNESRRLKKDDLWH